MGIFFLILGITCINSCLFFAAKRILTLESKVNTLEKYCIDTNRKVEETLLLSSGKTPLFESGTNKLNKAQLGNLNSIWKAAKTQNNKREVIPVQTKKGTFRIYRDSTVEEVLDILGNPFDTKTSGNETHLTYPKSSYSYLHIDFNKNCLTEIH